MPIAAKVTSVEALEAFRTNLIIYLSKARPALEEVSDQVIRTRVWLESDQRVFWERELRRRTQKWNDAQQAMFSAELSNLREVSADERMAVQKTKRAVVEAEEKLQQIKKWNRQFASQIEPLAKQMEKLQTVLLTNLPEAVGYLREAVKSLQAYSDITPTENPASAAATASDQGVDLPKANA